MTRCNAICTAACGSARGPRNACSSRSSEPTTSHVSPESWSRTAYAASRRRRHGVGQGAGALLVDDEAVELGAGRRQLGRRTLADEPRIRRRDRGEGGEEGAERGDAGVVRAPLEVVAAVVRRRAAAGSCPPPARRSGRARTGSRRRATGSTPSGLRPRPAVPSAARTRSGRSGSDASTHVSLLAAPA